METSKREGDFDGEATEEGTYQHALALEVILMGGQKLLSGKRTISCMPHSLSDSEYIRGLAT